MDVYLYEYEVIDYFCERTNIFYMVQESKVILYSKKLDVFLKDNNGILIGYTEDSSYHAPDELDNNTGRLTKIGIL